MACCARLRPCPARPKPRPVKACASGKYSAWGEVAHEKDVEGHESNAMVCLDRTEMECRALQASRQILSNYGGQLVGKGPKMVLSTDCRMHAHMPDAT